MNTILRMIYIQVKRLLAYSKPAKWELIFGILGTSVNGLLTTWMIADLMGNGIAAFEQRSMYMLWQAVTGALPLFLLTMVIQMISTWFTGKATATGTVALRNELIGTMLKSSPASMNKSHSGLKLSYFTNDVNAAMSSLVSSLSRPLRAVFVSIGGLVYIISVHWSLAVITVIMGIAVYIYSIYLAKRLHIIAMVVQKCLADMEILIKDLLDGMVTARMYQMERHLQDKAENVAEELRREGTRWAWLSGVLGGANNIAMDIAVRAILFAAGLFVLKGLMDIPTLVRVSQMAAGAIGVFMINRILIEIQRSLVGAERIFAFLDNNEEEQGGTVCLPESSNPVIRLDNVSFGYSPDVMVVRDFSMQVNKGEFVAIAGTSGSGKSTILRLIQGLYRADSGNVEALGTDVTNWNLSALRQQIALVPQEPLLFPGTIEENIVIGGRRDVDRDKLWKAAEAAGIHDFIMALPNGYATQMSERGDSISGGQRQRIALARAFYRNAPILLLDEATSAMDSVSETHVYNTLRSLAGEKTILFVTHRAAVIAISDRVVEFDGRAY